MFLPVKSAVVITVMFCISLSTMPACAENAMDGEPDESSAREEIDRAVPARMQQEAKQAEQDQTFEIYAFKLEGNTIFPTQRLLDLLDELVGPGKTATEVEKGRDILEMFYHGEGYPTVLVNIPEQKVEEGIIHLQVIESRVNIAKVTGNRYFSSDLILGKLPSLAPGAIIYIPEVQNEINKVNRNPDLKVMPAIVPGKEPGTVDVELKAEDHRPFHGNIEINNRNSHDTTPLRINMGAHYDNLWGMEHSFSLQYQFSPQNFSEVEVVSASYMLPAPWRKESNLVVYGVYSNSNTTFGDAFNTLGKGDIIGTRYIIPLSPYKSYNHSAILGFDYKHFDQTTSQEGATVTTTPVEYMPFSIAYSGSIPDPSGFTLLNAGVNVAFRGLIAKEQSFNDKRFEARSNYFFAAFGAERRQRLPGGFGLGVKLDGQLASQPLISNEQYAAGGMESVRGYKESEVMGDSAFHGMIDLSAPDLAPFIKLGEKYSLIPYTFYDFAALWVKEPLPDQDAAMDIQGAGIGIRGFIFKNVEYQAEGAFALVDTNKIKKGDIQVHFKAKYQF